MVLVVELVLVDPDPLPKSCTKAAKLLGLDRLLSRLELYCQYVASYTLSRVIHCAMSLMKVGSSPPPPPKLAAETTPPSFDDGSGSNPHSGSVICLPCEAANDASQSRPYGSVR